MDASGWYWLAWLLVAFLPFELRAAIATPGKRDTFSEWIWWAFGIKHGRPPLRPWLRVRRIVLAGFMGSLSGHFVFGWSAVPLVVFGAGVAAVLARAIGWERGRA